jgi:hypothetical protein
MRNSLVRNMMAQTHRAKLLVYDTYVTPYLHGTIFKLDVINYGLSFSLFLHKFFLNMFIHRDILGDRFIVGPLAASYGSHNLKSFLPPVPLLPLQHLTDLHHVVVTFPVGIAIEFNCSGETIRLLEFDTFL